MKLVKSAATVLGAGALVVSAALPAFASSGAFYVASAHLVTSSSSLHAGEVLRVKGKSFTVVSQDGSAYRVSQAFPTSDVGHSFAL